MSMRVNKESYASLVQDLTTALENGTIGNLEKRIVIAIMIDSLDMHYDLLPAIDKVMAIQDCTWKDAVRDEDLDTIRKYIEREYEDNC